MVKGLSKRVVVVRFSEEKAFEQAIFFMRESAADRKGVSADDIIREACMVAESCVGGRRKRKRGLHWLVYTIAGASATAFVWLLSCIVW